MLFCCLFRGNGSTHYNTFYFIRFTLESTVFCPLPYPITKVWLTNSQGTHRHGLYSKGNRPIVCEIISDELILTPYEHINGIQLRVRTSKCHHKYATHILPTCIFLPSLFRSSVLYKEITSFDAVPVRYSVLRNKFKLIHSFPFYVVLTNAIFQEYIPTQFDWLN
jgi:hypothetical protein